jgi:hypothetical protein
VREENDMSIIAGKDLGVKVCEALDLPVDQVRRVIIDIPASGAVLVYVELFASESILDLDWNKGLQGAQVTILDKTK